MNVKNLNPLERHVEKIVLAVALAGAAYIGYLAWQPITIENTEVTAKDVEPKVTQAVVEINQLKEDVQKKGDLTPKIHNYLEDYRKGIEGVPVPPELVTANIPQFGPKNVPVERQGTTGTHNDNMQIVTPTVPAPAEVTSVADLFVVNDPPQLDAAGNPIPPSPGLPPSTHNVTLVDVSGTISLQDFLTQMNNPALKRNEKLPPEMQRAIVYRIEVRRRQRVAGAWGPWQPIAPSRVGGDLPVIDWDSLPDAALGQAMGDVDAMFKRIVEPDFYTLPNNTVFTPPIVTALNKAKAAAPAPGTPGAAVPGRPLTPVAPLVQPADDEGGSVNSSTLTPDVAAMKALPNVPFWVFDETAVGGGEYQYEARLVMVNPTYRSIYTLKNPDAAKEPLLYSPWTIVASPVTVPSDQYFFVSSNLGNKNMVRIGVQIYKWLNGTWYSKDTNVQLGDQIAGNVLIPNAVPPLPTTVDVNTGYTLVDVATVVGVSGPDTEAILLSPDGVLIRRSAKADAANDLHTHLIQNLYHPQVSAPTTQATGAGTGTGTTVTPGRPVLPPPPRNTRNTDND